MSHSAFYSFASQNGENLTTKNVRF